VARDVVAAVRERGDDAIVELTAKYEGRSIAPHEFELDPMTWHTASTRVPTSLRTALERAAESIRTFHRTQIPSSTGTTSETARLESRVDALERVAMYVPGGTASYPSSVLMSAIPAKVAGVRELIMLTPRPVDVVLAAAEIAGVDRIFAIGGAQAIAAVAFGTRTVPRVDKVVGPGNAYVTAAKRLVFGRCDIDSIAGPSEILVMADETADPDLVAADLISQAEHDVLACPVLITDDAGLADAVDAALEQQLRDLPRRDIAMRALLDHGAVVLVEGRDAMVTEANAYAPEHVALMVSEPAALADRITCAGAIFVGAWTPEAAGDYAAGPSHVLPTAGGARFSSPLGVWDFVKYTSVLELGHHWLESAAPTITTLARAEGFEGHARAVELRLSKHRGKERSS